MIDEQLEFQISQYADGTLPAAETAALEEELAEDAEARQLLEEYRALNGMIERELAAPEMNWERLGAHISAVVAQEDAAANDAKQSYRIAWPTWGRVAIAAMVLIAVGLAFLHLRPRGGQTVVVVGPPPAPELAPVVVVTGPAAERAPGEVIEIVSIQPSALASNRYRPADDVVYRAPRVVIASGLSDRQDSGRLPF